LLSSLAAVGRTLVASSGGVLANSLGWAPFFLLSTIATVPALLLLAWLMTQGSDQAKPPAQANASPNR
jgi:PAT family beta-lactamase induction signal transducer AmpG